MCGIAGIIGISMAHEASEKACRNMAAALKHRGPDARGVFHSPSGHARLVHTRLSIIDPSERSNQPMHHGKRFTVVFNGEIYNFRELRRELEDAGSEFITDSDTEILPALYEHYGTGGFKRLRGMYAFALWDELEQICILARDPFGIKPLYYCRCSDGLIFSSEIKALYASGMTTPDLSPSGIASYLRWGSADPENLPVKNIETLPPAHCLRFPDTESSLTRFQNIPWESQADNASVHDFREAFIEAVRSHLVSDVPVGLFLSGGLDSASILCAARESHADDLQAFSLSFPETGLDESEAVRAIAHHFGISVTCHELEESSLPELFLNFLEKQDLPSIDGFNTYCISRLASRHGCKVALSGLGGDELLGSYPSFARIPRLLKVGRIVGMLKAGPLLNQGLFLLPGNRSAKLAEYFSGPPSLQSAYAACRALFTEEDVARLMTQAGLNGPISPRSEISSSPESLDASLWRISCLEATQYMRNQLLRDSDACSMQHGVEVRVPFVDPILWQKASMLSASLRYRSGKQLLRQALPELPPWLFTLPKRGFSLPYEQWRRGPLKAHFASLPHLPNRQPMTWYQEMALLSLNHWRGTLGI